MEMARSPLKDATNAPQQSPSKQGGGVKESAKRDSLSSSLLKGEDSFDKLSECSFTSALSHIKSADLDTTAEFESAGEQEPSPSSSIFFEGEETLVQDPLNFTVLSSELEKIHLSTPKVHSGKGFPFNDKLGTFDIPEDQLTLFARTSNLNLSDNADNGSDLNKTQTFHIEPALNDTVDSVTNQELLKDQVNVLASSPGLNLSANSDKSNDLNKTQILCTEPILNDTVDSVKNQGLLKDHLNLLPSSQCLNLSADSDKSNDLNKNEILCTEPVLNDTVDSVKNQELLKDQLNLFASSLSLNLSANSDKSNSFNKTQTLNNQSTGTDDSIKNQELLHNASSPQSNLNLDSKSQFENCEVPNLESGIETSVCDKSSIDTNNKNNLYEDFSNSSNDKISDFNQIILHSQAILNDSDTLVKNQEVLSDTISLQSSLTHDSINQFKNCQETSSENRVAPSNKPPTVLTNGDLNKNDNTFHTKLILNNTDVAVKNEEVLSSAITCLSNQFENFQVPNLESGSELSLCNKSLTVSPNANYQYNFVDGSTTSFKDNISVINKTVTLHPDTVLNNTDSLLKNQEVLSSVVSSQIIAAPDSEIQFGNCQETNLESKRELFVCTKTSSGSPNVNDQNNLSILLSSKETHKECHINEDLTSNSKISETPDCSVSTEKFGNSILISQPEIRILSTNLNTISDTDITFNEYIPTFDKVKLTPDVTGGNFSATNISLAESHSTVDSPVCNSNTEAIEKFSLLDGSDLFNSTDLKTVFNTEDINIGRGEKDKSVVTWTSSEEKKKNNSFSNMKPEDEKCDGATAYEAVSLQNDYLLENEEPPPSLDALSLDFMPNDPMQEDMMKTDPSQECNNSEAGPITADEHISGEFEHPSDLDLDFLSKKGLRKRPPSKLARESLFVKFDPLVHEQEEQDSQIMSESEVVTSDVSSKNEEKTPSKNLQDDILVPITPVVPKQPRSNPQSGDSTPRSKLTNSATAVRQEVLSKEISKLQHLMLQQEHSYEALVTEKVNQLSKAEETIDSLTQKLEQLQSKHPVKLEQRLTSLEENNEKLKKENAELVESKNLFKVIIEEYEKAISQYHSKHERLKLEFDSEKEALISERDTVNRHLANTEMAFNDVHSKYEKCKAAIEKFKTNETILQASIKESAEKIQVMEDRYQKLHDHATKKLDMANIELATLKKNHQTELAKMMALVKKSELSLKSMEGTIEQKNKEINELTKICDELIEKVNH